MPLSPALVHKPLSFHSDKDKNGYILYQGRSCDRIGWNARCHDEVCSKYMIFRAKAHLVYRRSTRSITSAQPLRSSLRTHRDVNLPIAARISGMKPTRISYIALLPTHQPQVADTPLHRVDFTRAPIFSKMKKPSRILASQKTQRVSLLLPLCPNTR